MVKLIEVGSKEFNEIIQQACETAAEIAVKTVRELTLPEYVDKEKALELLGRKKTSNIHKLIVSGKIKTSKDGRIVMYETASIIEYLRNNKRK